MEDISLNDMTFLSIVGMIVMFFFGQSGILNRWFDYFFKTKENEQTELQQKEQEIHMLRQEVQELRTIIAKLDKDLVETTMYVKTLLTYLETKFPDGSDQFIKDISNNFKTKTNIL